MLADARTSQVALLGPPPQNPDAPGYAYQGEVPPGYVYLLSEHMAGAIQSPQTTPGQHTLAIQINRELDGAKRLFEQMERDAKHLLNMSAVQLLQPAALTLLNDLATQAQDAYTGQLDPSTGQANGGALQIYGNLQQMASLMCGSSRHKHHTVYVVCLSPWCFTPLRFHDHAGLSMAF